jgi:hypothetical protein
VPFPGLDAENVAELKAQEKALVWKQDQRILPFCVVIYLLCYLDRSNIGENISRIHNCSSVQEQYVLTNRSGNARILNADHHHDLLSITEMTNYQYM